jgi:hypothetical protein
MVIQLSNPVEYTGEGVAVRGSLDEKGIWPTGAESGPRAYQRVWLIDSDHKEDEEENASEEGSDEGTPDASTERQSRTVGPRGPAVLATATTAATARARWTTRRDLWRRLTASDIIGRRRARRRRSPRPKKDFPPPERRRQRWCTP